MKDLNYEYGDINFNAIEVAKETQGNWVKAHKKSFPQLSEAELKEIHVKCKQLVAEAEKENKPAPGEPEV